MKKVFFTFVLLALMGLKVSAENVNVTTAKNLGAKFLKYNTNLEISDLHLSYTAVTENGSTAFYVFSNNGKGFVIVSADNRMRPILGYSTDGHFDADNISPALNTFFQNYMAGVDYVVDNNLEMTTEAESDWKSLNTTGKLSVDRINRSVAPLVTTTWNQSDLYNSMCPEDPAGYGGHVKSGCVANAMAQIMNYWEWPQTGRGSHSYYSDYGLLEVNFGEANYQFELMPDFLDYTTPQTEVDAVALLQYHAGVSVDMMYGPTASGAFSFDVPYAMRDYFCYSSEMYSSSLDYVGMSVWEDMLRENLDRGEPLYYSAYGSAGGHAFVCSGYDENNLFHFNWGWQGFDNGYYAIDNFYLTNYSFPWGHDAIFNMKPESSYYSAPLEMENLVIEPDHEKLVNHISFFTPAVYGAKETLYVLDSVVILRNDELIHTFHNPSNGETLYYDDDLERNGVNYYIIYGFADGLKSRAVIDTVMTGPACEMTFNLYDSDNDGWLSPSISVLDSRGIVVKRIGLQEGSEAVLNVSVPDNDSISFFWNYTNLSYSNQDDECSFEILHEGEMIYASEGTPVVGPISTYYIDCQHDNIEENELINTVDIFPNPTNESLNIVGIDAENITIYNHLGQEIMNVNVLSNIVDVSNLPNGLYLINVKDKDNKIVVKKFVKN